MKVTFNKKNLFRRGYFSARLRLTSAALLSGLGASALAFGGVSAGFPVVRETKESKDGPRLVVRSEVGLRFKTLSPASFGYGLALGVSGNAGYDILKKIGSFLFGANREKDDVSSKLDTVIDLLKRIESSGEQKKTEKQRLLEQAYVLKESALSMLQEVDDLIENAKDLEADTRDIADRTNDTDIFLEALDLLRDIRSFKRTLSDLKHDIYAHLQRIYSLILELL